MRQAPNQPPAPEALALPCSAFEGKIPPRKGGSGIPILLLLLALTPFLVGAQERAEPPACIDDPDYSKLDFWLGEWSVSDGEKTLGHNRIEKILDGCAVVEHWTDAEGNRGQSLFYLAQIPGKSGERVWKQVWVTEYAASPGGTKEKSLVRESEDGSLSFQGEITLNEERTYLDRTTLSPLPDGTVRQLIEISTDRGIRWRPVFDAIYRRSGS